MSRRSKRAESRARYYIREEAKRRGWQVQHASRGGDVLEEQEIQSFYSDIGLGLDKPDFLFSLQGEPVILVEAKNDADKINQALKEAMEYADTINSNSNYRIKIAIGAAGEEDKGFITRVAYLSTQGWTPLVSNGFELTTLPTKRETDLALIADNGSTTVSIPSSVEFIDAALELSKLLRLAKVEAPLRPKVIGSMILAMYQGEIDLQETESLTSINTLIETAINESESISVEKKAGLIDALTLSGADFNRMTPFIRRIVAILRRLNIRSVLQTDTDFLGMFYEAFLRYGYDNNALGIVFTPRHITKYCVDLIGVSPNDKVIDIASGTGGFLVAAFDKMMEQAEGIRMIEQVKRSLYGFDTNPTVWALATLNMFFRGDGKSHIEQGNSLTVENRASVEGKFTRAFLNPPFSQEGEPERDFIDVAMSTLEPGGLIAVVVYAGIFADDEHRLWRKEFLRNHTLMAVISLPEDLFYPNASAPTSIMVAKAHIPHRERNVFLARIWNDGFNKLKNRRIEQAGSQLKEVFESFNNFKNGEGFHSELVIIVNGDDLADGEEWSPQEWLPQPEIDETVMEHLMQSTIKSLFQTTALFPELADVVKSNFPEEPYSEDESKLDEEQNDGAMEMSEDLPLNTTQKLSYFFKLENGKSVGEKNFTDGEIPYISSGDSSNSIVRLVQVPDENQIFEGGITVTAFGKAYLQPWDFVARGNGGSSVRVLVPKFNMTFKELAWFVAQINAQQWRFFYARMAIKSRITRLLVKSPHTRLYNVDLDIAERIQNFKNDLESYSEL
ncbi:N-6 DNA methylase [Paenibacillus amylolyticus]|uniref:N-6 DNA methylase n=1 Tax=Paenibacillus amylolyticus TaxID=1451 RepID=UPI00344E8CCD